MKKKKSGKNVLFEEQKSSLKLSPPHCVHEKGRKTFRLVHQLETIKGNRKMSDLLFLSQFSCHIKLLHSSFRATETIERKEATLLSSSLVALNEQCFFKMTKLPQQLKSKNSFKKIDETRSIDQLN